jgi:hypothetical protein
VQCFFTGPNNMFPHSLNLCPLAGGGIKVCNPQLIYDFFRKLVFLETQQCRIISHGLSPFNSLVYSSTLSEQRFQLFFEFIEIEFANYTNITKASVSCPLLENSALVEPNVMHGTPVCPKTTNIAYEYQAKLEFF